MTRDFGKAWPLNTRPEIPHQATYLQAVKKHGNVQHYAVIDTSLEHVEDKEKGSAFIDL